MKMLMLMEPKAEQKLEIETDHDHYMFVKCRHCGTEQDARREQGDLSPIICVACGRAVKFLHKTRFSQEKWLDNNSPCVGRSSLKPKTPCKVFKRGILIETII